MIDAMARALDIAPRPRLAIPFLRPGHTSLAANLLTSADKGIAGPLMNGMEVETIVKDPSGMALFDFEPMSIDEAMKAALEERNNGG
jgi:hypothetical protein